MHNVSFMDIVTWAFDMQLWDVVVPNWAEPRPGQPLYVIDAEANGPVAEQRVRWMLQRLLAERFQFAAHHEVRIGVHSVLRVSKGGLKIKEGAVVEGTPKVRNESSAIIFTGVTIPEFLRRLNVTSAGEPIYDQTDLRGRYNFTFDYGKYLQFSDADHTLNVREARIDAMHDLGLEVVEVKIPVDTLVVDHAEKIPTAN